MTRFFFALSLFLGCLPAAAADLVLTFTQTVPGSSPAQFEISCAKDRVAVRALGPDAFRLPKYVYRSDLGVLWAISSMWHNYTQQDSVTEIDQRSDKNSPRRSQERILARPAGERAQAVAEEEALQAARLRFSKVEFTASGKRETVAGLPCEVWVATGGEGPDSTSIGGPNPAWRDEVWVTPWSAVSNSELLKAVALDAGATFARWWAGLPVHGGERTVVRAIPKLGGCPVRVRHYVANELLVEYALTGTALREIPPETYVVPDGFDRTEH